MDFLILVGIELLHRKPSEKLTEISLVFPNDPWALMLYSETNVYNRLIYITN